MDLLPAEIWCHIFEYLDSDSVINVCDASEYFRELVTLCRYPHFRQYIDYNTRHLLNCGEYDIRVYFDPIQWVNINEFDDDNKLSEHLSNMRLRFNELMRNKSVKILKYRNDGIQLETMFDYSLISGCYEVILENVESLCFPEALEGTELVTIEFLYIDDRHLDRINEDEIGRYDNYNMIYLRKSRSVRFVNSWKYLDFSTFSNEFGIIERLGLSKCHNVYNEHLILFKDLIYLNLSCTLITSTEYLDNIEELNISETDITDITNLRKVRNLRLYRCLKITDFTPVAEVEILDVMCCNVKDLAIFSKVKKLYICYNHDVYKESVPSANTEVIGCFCDGLMIGYL